MPVKKLALLLLAGVALSTTADAVPTIVISASRTEQPGITIPASITVIGRQEIINHGHRNLADLLRVRGGVQIQDLFGDGSSATIDMRGFGPTAVSNTLVLVDGRRLNNSGDMGSLDLNSIDLENVEQIEIVQGSAGTLFGNQAVGGVINIITRRPRTFQATVQGETGDYQGYRLKGSTAGRLDNGLAYRLTARTQENDNYRRNNSTHLKDLALRLDYPLSRGAVFFELQGINDEIELPGSLFADELAADRRQSIAVYRDDFSKTRTAVGRLGWRHDLTPEWRFEGELTYRNNDREFRSSFRTFPGSLATQDRRVRGFNPRLIGAIPTAAGDIAITAGVDLERTDYRLLTSFGPQNLDQSIDALYVQAVIPHNPHWSTTLGLRHARVNNDIDTGAAPSRLDDDVTVGSIGIVYRPDDAWRFFTRLDQNYRFATVDEHTNVVFGQPVGIDNQTGLSYEAGAELTTPGYRTKLVLYFLELKDEISFDATGFVNTNLDRTRRKGLILEGEWSPKPHWSLGGSYSFTDTEITGGPFKGNRIPLVSKQSARLFSDIMIAPHWSLFTEALLLSDQILGSDFSNSFPRLPGYGVINAALRYRQGPWLFTLRGNNLLDKAYSASGAVGFDATFTRRDAYFPAPERNLWLTVRYHLD